MPTALVTGGAKRLGRSIALHLARQKYDIVLHYHNSASEAESTAEAIAQIGVKCRLLQADLRNAERITEFLTKEHISPDLLVCSASYYTAGTISSSPLQLFDDMYQINLRSAIHLTRFMADTEQPGSVILFLDNKLHFNQNVYAAYLLFRKALGEFMKMAALEYAPVLRVNAIAPGVIMPDEQRSTAYIDWRVEGIPLRKQGKPDNLLMAIDFLIANDFMTGQMLTIDGGEHLTQTGRNSENYPGKK